MGFAVIRPFNPPLFGRTVIALYPDDPLRRGRRVTTPSRDYFVHLVGVRLAVKGLAWQPQDAAVGACATIALWTMLHSSAFDDHHAIPTTAAITIDAHRDNSYGRPAFPSPGLTSFQLSGAIKAQRLSPIIIEGDKDTGKGFSRQRFLSTCAAFLRSGYPVLLTGKLGGEHHAICATGFREPEGTNRPGSDEVRLHDDDIEHVYVHEDNLGPGVRCRVEERDGRVRLVAEAPPSRATPVYPDPTTGYAEFCPMSMIVAAHEDIRITPDGLHDLGLQIAKLLLLAVRRFSPLKHPNVDLSLQTRFICVREYLSVEIAASGLAPEVLSRVRFSLTEVAAPMSLHLGLVQISINQRPTLHVLFDTTDNERFCRAFAYLAFDKRIGQLASLVAESQGIDLGKGIDAFF